MCIIAISPKNNPIPSSDTRKKMFENNPDGAGFMYPYKGKVRIEKGFMTLDAMETRLQEVSKVIDTTKTPMIFHYRITTHGGTSQANTHPFPVTNNRKLLQLTRVDASLGVAHNGIINCVKPKDGFSDTQEYIVKRLSQLDSKFVFSSKKLGKIAKEINGSRLAFLTPNGEIARVGTWETGKDGCLYSNTSYKWTRYKYEPIDWKSLYNSYKDYRTSAYRGWSPWDDDDDYGYNITDFSSYRRVTENTMRDLSGYEVVDEDGELHEGEAYCMDVYGRIYKYTSNGCAVLVDGARLLDGRAQMSLLSDLEGDDGLPF